MRTNPYSPTSRSSIHSERPDDMTSEHRQLTPRVTCRRKPPGKSYACILKYDTDSSLVPKSDIQESLDNIPVFELSAIPHTCIQSYTEEGEGMQYEYGVQSGLENSFQLLKTGPRTTHVPDKSFGNTNVTCKSSGTTYQTVKANAFWIILAIVIVLVLISYFNPPKLVPASHQDSGFDLRKKVQELRKMFPSQAPYLWPSFTAGINRTITDDPNRPSSFVLVHNNRKTSECLAKQIGQVAATFLNDKRQEPVVIDGSDVKNNKSFQEDYGSFIDSYKPLMENIGVMVVNNLQEIPGTIARTFHTLCDEFNPAVKKAVYFFTLETNDINNKSPTKVAEETLSSLWQSDLDGDTMHPLITRITGDVFVVNAEEQNPCNES